MEPQTPPSSPWDRIAIAIAKLLNPIVFTALMILTTTILLIGANLVGLDKGEVLNKLKDGEYARGLITYLFSVGTIGSFVVLILAALIGIGNPDERQERFTRAKEIFTLLIGIFGSIIGFYFGSVKAEQETQNQAAAADTTVTASLLMPESDDGRAVALIRGGQAPYFVVVTVQPTATESLVRPAAGPVRVVNLRAPNQADSLFALRMQVIDGRGDTVTVAKPIRIVWGEGP